MTLRELGMGRPACITGFSGLSAPEQARVEAMGLCAGESVTKLLKVPLQDPVECLAGSQLLAVEAWLMDHILVSLR